MVKDLYEYFVHMLLKIHYKLKVSQSYKLFNNTRFTPNSWSSLLVEGGGVGR